MPLAGSIFSNCRKSRIITRGGWVGAAVIGAAIVTGLGVGLGRSVGCIGSVGCIVGILSVVAAAVDALLLSKLLTPTANRLLSTSPPTKLAQDQRRRVVNCVGVDENRGE